MSAIVRALRPGQEPPEPPEPQEPVVLTGSVCLTTSERAAFSAISGVAQRFARITSGPSSPAAMVADIPAHIAAMRSALDLLQSAHEAANEVRSAS